MEEKRDEGELMKHACKLCKKIYPSGKSLGGHMRSHMIANSQKNKPIIPKKVVNKFDYDDEDEDDDDEEDEDEEDDIGAKNSGYGLRENPKKTWRLVGSTFKKKQAAQFQTQQQQQVQEEERICKQCGKGFQSLKALCGHMSSHSERERDRNFHNKVEEDDDDDDCSWSSDSKDQLISAMESHSDNNNNGSISIMNSKRETRSSMSRYKHYRSLNANANTNTSGVDSVSPNGNGNGNGSPSNHSEIDQHEQEEVAICLMMLSRDSSSSLHFNFTTAESSDNNSVILEGGSSSNYVGIKRKHLSSLIKDDDQNKVIHEMDNSDSGYFENGAKELESDASVDAFYFSKPNIDIINTTGSKESFHFNSSDSPQSDENSNKKKRINNNTHYCYSNNTNHNNVVSKKGSKYECGVCQKTFNTHQALGGHIISHSRKTLNADNTFLEKTTKISPKKVVVVTHSKSNKPSKPKKGKGHNCPFCPRVFKSGQALGGHKRSHMMGSSSNYVGNLTLERERERVRPSPRHQPEEQPKQPTLIDLNLPAPMDEEGSGNSNSQFVASW